MEIKDKYTLKEALQIIAKHMKDLADKAKDSSDSKESKETK